MRAHHGGRVGAPAHAVQFLLWNPFKAIAVHQILGRGLPGQVVARAVSVNFPFPKARQPRHHHRCDHNGDHQRLYAFDPAKPIIARRHIQKRRPAKARYRQSGHLAQRIGEHQQHERQTHATQNRPVGRLRMVH